LHVAGAIVFPFGIAQTLLGGSVGFTIFGSLIVLTAMALFAWIVFRTTAA
jgi:hypothetical protein